MLEPQSRQELQKNLRPPDGYILDQLIGTTFSLDLLALLTVPLSFTFYEGEDRNNGPDPLALLDGVRRYAEKITIFCQAGQISIPKPDQLLYSFLEDCVIEVIPRSSKGVFHPKVWAIRYISEDKEVARPVRYRLLVLSRNLTFDKSWDTMLVLDGRLSDRRYAFGNLHPLGDFFAELPNLAVRDVSQDIKQRIELVEYELRRTVFDCPTPFTDMSFHPMGLKRGKSWPFLDWKTGLLIISPFLAKEFLVDISQGCGNNVLISRLESLVEIESEALASFSSIFTLSPNANLENETETNEFETVDINEDIELSGLHAKVFIEEKGWDAHLWTGSANATNAAFHHNVEFMVCLKGKRSKIGIQAILKEKDEEQEKEQISFKKLLEPYTPSTEKQAIDNIKKRLERTLFQAQRQLVEAGITTKVLLDNGQDRYKMQLVTKKTWAWDKDLDAHCWPITLQENMSVPLNTTNSMVANINSISLEAITAFFACELTATYQGQRMSKRFVLNLPIDSPPSDRHERLLRALLKDKRHVLRYLLLLLAEDGSLYETFFYNRISRHKTKDGDHLQLGLSGNLFESLVETLASNPSKLEYINRLIKDLGQTDGLPLLPEGFLDIWQPVWEAYKSLRSIEATQVKVADHE